VIPSSYRNPEVGFGMPLNIDFGAYVILARLQKKEIQMT
jgi:hypothetical protein